MPIFERRAPDSQGDVVARKRVARRFVRTSSGSSRTECSSPRETGATPSTYPFHMSGQQQQPGGAYLKHRHPRHES